MGVDEAENKKDVRASVCIFARNDMDMDIRIDISMDDIMSAVHERTAYVGSKMSGQMPGAYERIATTYADEQFLARSIKEGCSVLYDVMYRYMPSAIVQDGKLSVYLLMPDSYNGGANAAVRDKLQQFFVSYAVGAWFSVTYKVDADAYKSAAASELAGIRVLLAERKHPTRVKPVEVRRETTRYE